MASDKYSAGYNSELDAVVISYDGTIGDIVEISGIRIALPKKPVDNKIVGYSRKRYNQIWEREPLPIGLEKKTLKTEKFKEYIASQYKMRKEGMWFYNDGKAEYVTGAHWFMMQWCKTGAETKGNYYYFTRKCS
jgi:hypothetical protein